MFCSVTSTAQNSLKKIKAVTTVYNIRPVNSFFHNYVISWFLGQISLTISAITPACLDVSIIVFTSSSGQLSSLRD